MLKTKLNEFFSSGERKNLAVWSVCLLLIILFNDSMNASAFTGTRQDLSEMSRGGMMRYARSMQAEVAQDPALFMSLKGEDIRLILAAPEMERIDGPTRVWQYRTASCVLDVYFTVTGESRADDAAVSHYEIRARALDGAVREKGCMTGLYDARESQIAEAFEIIFASYTYQRDPLEG